MIEGEREFLGDLAVDERNLAEAFRLGPGAPFYLSELFISINREQTAEQLLALQWRRGESPWREEAALVLIERYLETDRYGEAETLARQLARRAREQKLKFRAERHLVEALYWQEEDKAVLAALEERRKNGAPWDEELDLFLAVSSQKLGRSVWQELFVDLFFNKRASELHPRAYAYLELENRLDTFSQPTILFFQGKNMLYRGQNEEAIELIERSLPALEPEGPDMDIVIQELGAAYIAVGQYGSGAEMLLDLSADLAPSQRLNAVEMAGRLYRKGGEFDKAEQQLSVVIRETTSQEQRDRAIWFVLDMARNRSADDLLEKIAVFAPRWQQPRYFSDILEAEISRLVARRDWDRLFALYRTLAGYGSPETVARLAYLNGRTVALGLADSSGLSLSPQALFLEARDTGEQYYRFLAETALAELGFPVQWRLVGPDGSGHTVQAVDGDEGSTAAAAALIRGYLDYGLYETGAELLRSQWQTVSADLLLESAMTLQDRAQYLWSIRLTSLYSLSKQEAPDRSDLERLYPKAYGQWIEEISQSEDLSAPIFFALVREESYFDPEIVSRSGAVGLTQLMAETAADSARWLRIQEFDLLNPEQNLRLGARHFSRLLGRLEDIPKALMAYNAGLSRLRGWERSFADLPTDLLAEAIPFPETRNYIRKILVSAVYYGALYYDLSLEQTVQLFFPGLEQ
ncbi:MAG: lytic transglycosylase domain-containing protein [Spirochaetaceae bacterium]|nr:MAG: lytic transglycosylase domain-containing protein [Spirochaetaceae bacterium]